MNLLGDINFALLIAEGIARDLGRTVTKDELGIILRWLGSLPDDSTPYDLLQHWNAAMREIREREAAAGGGA